MSDINKIPLIDSFETTLAQQYTWWLGTVHLNEVPTFTFPSWVTCYMVINPGRSNMQVVEIDSIGSGTVNVSSITVKKGAGVNYTATTHGAQSKVIISDNYQYWEDMRTAVNSKLDQNWGNGITYINEAARDAALGGNGVATKEYRLIKVTSTWLFYNYNLTSGEWESVDTWVATPNASTTVAGKVEIATSAERASSTATWSTWAILVPSNDALVKTSSWVADENKIPILDSSGKLALWFMPSGVWVETKFGTWSDGVQWDSNLTITWSNNTYIEKNFTSWTAWSTARTCTITPTNCLVWIRIQGNADFTNWTFNFTWKWGQANSYGNGFNLTACNKGNAGTQWNPWIGGIWWLKISNNTISSLLDLNMWCWSGWGTGWDWQNWPWGIGWAWGGGLLITVWGNVIFSSTTANFNGTNWANGANWGNSWSGAWGWGWGGTLALFYKGTLTGSLTPNVAGWLAGTWGTYWGGSTLNGWGWGWGWGSIFNDWTNGTDSALWVWWAWGVGGAWAYVIKKL